MFINMKYYVYKVRNCLGEICDIGNLVWEVFYFLFKRVFREK